MLEPTTVNERMYDLSDAILVANESILNEIAQIEAKQKSCVRRGDAWHKRVLRLRELRKAYKFLNAEFDKLVP